jgi:hypothetical protein
MKEMGNDPRSPANLNAFGGLCFLCNQQGHKLQYWPSNTVRATDQANISWDSEIVMIGAESENLDQHIWIADYGATSHDLP